jgi:GNAT superfamily N-acetyltransferase
VTSLHASLATADHVDAVYALLSAAGERLAARGFPNWLPAYPRERVAENVSEGIVWMVSEGDGGRRAEVMVATWTLRPIPTHPYAGIAWHDAHAIARYLNRLAVTPEHQGRGIGRWCLARIAEQCAGDAVAAVRCDVLQAHVPLRRFYERHGYESRGNRFHSGWRFEVYERVLAQR